MCCLAFSKIGNTEPDQFSEEPLVCFHIKQNTFMLHSSVSKFIDCSSRSSSGVDFCVSILSLSLDRHGSPRCLHVSDAVRRRPGATGLSISRGYLLINKIRWTSGLSVFESQPIMSSSCSYDCSNNNNIEGYLDIDPDNDITGPGVS